VRAPGDQAKGPAVSTSPRARRELIKSCVPIISRMRSSWPMLAKEDAQCSGGQTGFWKPTVPR
jgi:hypothetical protein